MYHKLKLKLRILKYRWDHSPKSPKNFIENCAFCYNLGKRFYWTSAYYHFYCISYHKHFKDRYKYFKKGLPFYFKEMKRVWFTGLWFKFNLPPKKTYENSN